MVTRVRIEAEGSTTAEVEAVLYAASETLTNGAGTVASEVMFGPDAEALANAHAGELVIERFAKDLKGEPGHGAIFFRGRMTTHYSPRTPALDLQFRQDTGAYVES